MTKRNLWIAAAVAAIVVLGGGGAILSVLTAGHHGNNRAQQTTGTLKATAFPPTSTITVPGAGGPTSIPAPPEQSQTDMSVRAAPKPADAVGAQAKKFVQALVTTKGVSSADWSKKIYTFTSTPEIGDQITLTDPSKIPTQHVTGDADLVSAAKTEAAATYFVPTSAQGFTVVMDTQQRKVLSVTPGKTSTEPTAVDND